MNLFCISNQTQHWCWWLPLWSPPWSPNTLVFTVFLCSVSYTVCWLSGLWCPQQPKSKTKLQTACPFMRLQGVLLEPIPAVSGQGQGTPWTTFQSLAACSTRWATTPTNSTCMLHPTCSGGYGCGGGWYRLTLLTGLFPATVAIFTSAHSVMSGITFWLILHVRCKKERQKQTKNYH